MKRVAIVQSNYIPWKGYFDLIDSVDEFVLLDEVQYTRRDWRNRNKIKTPQGLKWLTIPVKVRGRYRQRIDETVIDGSGWVESHWGAISQAYREAPCFDHFGPRIEALYRSCDSDMLSDVNRHLLEGICEILGIETRLSKSTDYRSSGEKSERLLSLCLDAGADEYVSGPAARAYLEAEPFREAGVQLSWFEYPEYSEYPQLHPPFEHAVSIVDLILNTGSSAPSYIRALEPTGGGDAA